MIKILLVCHVSSNIGIGHFSRLLALAVELKKDSKLVPEFLIFGDVVKKKELSNFTVHSFSLADDFIASMNEFLIKNSYTVIVFDLYPRHNIQDLDKLLNNLKQRGIYLVGIDALITHCESLDIVWVPAFSFDFSGYAGCRGLLRSGWDSLLIQKRLKERAWVPGSRVLILTGGGDAARLGEALPTQLDVSLDQGTSVHWVRGPFSKAPVLPEICRLHWTIYDAPERLDELIIQSDYVMTVFGVTFFEVLQYGIPTVVFSPYGTKDSNELAALSKERVADVAFSLTGAVTSLVSLMNDESLAREYSLNALNKMSVNGAENLCNELYSLMRLS